MPSDASTTVPGGSSEARLERWVGLGLLAIALAVASVVCVDALRVVGLNPRDDEGVYRSFVQRLDHRGLGAYPSLFRDFNSDPQHWMAPLPSRVGYVLVVWLAAQLAGLSFALLSNISFVAHLALVALNFVCARRRIGSLRAGMFSIGLACSPLLLRLGVQPMTDSMVLAAESLSVWWFLDLVEGPSRRRLVRFIAVFTSALLIKELSILLVPCFAMIAVALRGRAQVRLRWSDLFVALALPGVLCVATWVVAAWSFVEPFQMFRTALESTKHNAYVESNYSGPWFNYVLDLTLLSPAATVVALATAGAIAADSRTSSATRSQLLLALGLLSISIFMGKNVRYFAALELPLRWLVVEGVWRASQRFSSRYAIAAAVSAALALAAIDVRSAVTTFAQLYDPVTSTLLQMRGW